MCCSLIVIVNRVVLLASLLLVAMLTACASVQVTDPNARFYVPPPGSKITVKQRLQIAGGQTRVFLQRGEILSKASQLDLYTPNCSFEVNTLADTPRYIEPGVYTVTRSWREEKEIVRSAPQPPRLAATQPVSSLVVTGDSDGPSMTFEETRMRLRSEHPSDIRELACRGVFKDPSQVEPPTLAEMRQALGAYANIEVPEEKTN